MCLGVFPACVCTESSGAGVIGGCKCETGNKPSCSVSASNALSGWGILLASYTFFFLFCPFFFFGERVFLELTMLASQWALWTLCLCSLLPQHWDLKVCTTRLGFSADQAQLLMLACQVLYLQSYLLNLYTLHFICTYTKCMCENLKLVLKTFFKGWGCSLMI